MPRTISMLVADDSSVAQNILTEAAHDSKLPLRLTTTDNGRDCLTLLNGANVDLAFVDVHMPELSGTEAVWSARTQGIQTFVTLMSSPPATEAVDLAIRLRAYEFLFKPFTAADATAIIKTYDRIASPTKILIHRRCARSCKKSFAVPCSIARSPKRAMATPPSPLAGRHRSMSYSSTATCPA
jgi:DNA-binding NtrC family response regulator